MRLFVALLSICLVWGCYLEQFPTQDELQGKWLAASTRGEIVIELREDMTFTVSNATSQSRMLWGNWSYEKGRISMTNSGGRYGENCGGTGIYEVFITGDELSFKQEKDRCGSRKLSTEKPWKRMNQ